MASDLSSGCTEVNDILDDEKEEGEISLEDVSSSEEGPTYKYLPRAVGQCRHCLLIHGPCAAWCSSLTVNQNNIKRDAGLQGKENRSNQRYHKDGYDVPILGHSSGSKTVPYSSSTLQEKNDYDALGTTANSDLVPISSCSEVEVDSSKEKHEKKSSHRRKVRKKRRKRSPDTLSLSPSPSPQDLALSIKDSIHRIKKNRLESGHSKYRHHHSPDRRKLASRPSPPLRRRVRSPLTNRPDRRRSRSPLKKTSPSRSRKTVQKKSPTLETPVKQSCNKLLKKVRNLETDNRSKEKGSSLKDKISNMIKQDKKEASPPAEKRKEPSTEPVPREEPKPAVTDKEERKEEVAKKPVVVEEKNNNNSSSNKDEDEEDLVVLRQIALETKSKKNVGLIKPENIKTEPVDELSAPPQPPSPHPQEPPPQEPPPPPLPSPQPSAPVQPEQQPPQKSQKKTEEKAEPKLPNFCMDENDEDLELRLIALHSAVIKKHKTRVAKGRRRKPETAVPRIESPFTSTFLEDFPMLAEICSPTSPLSSKRDILSAEDMELDSDMESSRALSEPEDQSPYSPSDDITGEMLLEHEIAQPVPVTPAAVQPIDKNKSPYSPTNPTETPAFAAQQSTKLPEGSSLDGSILEFANQESRPYSPSDATVYDPDLPGVHSPVKSAALTTTTTSSLASLPLQPPPMPPLSMFGPQQTMLLGCPPSMLNAFGDPIAMVPPPMVTSFPALHQSVNPLLLPSAPPLFAYPTAHSVAMPIPPPQPQLQPQQPQITSKPETNELDNFMETDLDGSPLVPIEKDGNDQRWQMLGEPLYLQNVPELTQSELSKLPTLMERSLVPAAVLRSNKQLQKQPLKKPMPSVGEALFRNADMRPVALDEGTDARAASFKPLKLQAQPKKNVITQPAAAFNSTLDDSVEAEEKPTKSKTEEEEKKEGSRTSPKKKEATETPDCKRKSKKPVSKHKSKELDSSRRSMREMLNERRKDLSRRVRERSYRLSRARSVSKSISKTKKSEETAKKDIPKTDDKRRRSSIEDDEQALRESLLASLAMRAKEPQPVAAPKPPSPEKSPAAQKPSPESISKSTDEMPLAERVSAFLAKSKARDLKNGTAPVSTTGTNQLKRSSEPLPAAVLPPRKIMKRVTSMTPASKVVNNAKRYQNLMLQRKLTQQVRSATINSRFKLNHARSASPIVTTPSSEINRIIINLNEDSESESEAEEARSQASPVKVRPTLNIPTTDFEKSVDQFLKNARQQQEMASTVNKNNGVSPKTANKNPSPMGPPPVSTPSVSKAVTANANTTTAKITVATPPFDGSVGSIVATTADAVIIAKDKVVGTPKVIKTTSKLPSATATPMAVKHLTAAQQEEYRLLKQMIQEREKSKESTSATAQPQPTLEKTTTTPSSSPISASLTSSSSTCPSSALSSSTTKAVAKIVLPTGTSVASSLPVKPREQVLEQNEPVPKKKLVAAISQTSKLSVKSLRAPVALSKPPQTSVTSTKIIHATPSINPNSTSLNKTAAVVTPTSTNKINAVASLTPQSNNNRILGMISESIHRQFQQITDAAQNLSSLRILTKEQINLKTSRIQKTRLNSEGNVVMDDLNKTTGNSQSITSKKFTGETNKQQGTNSVERVATAIALKNDSRKDSSSSDSTKISSAETLQDTNKTKQNWENFKEVVNDEIQALSHLPAHQQKELLSKTEESLIEKRRSVVDDIAEMSLKLREWEIERDLQYKYNEEAKKLREELRKVEEKIQQQKDKLNTIHPQVSLYHKKINSGRKECFKLSKICNSLGQQIVGSNYIVPAAGAEILNNRIKEVVKHTQKLQNKTTQYKDTVNNNLGKTDNNISNKNFFKSNNLSKRKEIVKQHNLNNNETDVLASNSISTINASKNEKSSIASNNISTCTNEMIIANPKIENDLINTNTENATTRHQHADSNTNNSLTSAERTNSVLNLNNTSNLETITNRNIANPILTTDSIVNVKIENAPVNLNNDNEIEKTNQIFNDKNDKQLPDTEKIILRSENTDNAGSFAKNSSIKMSSTMDYSESESITNENNLNNLDNQRSIMQSGVENSVLNSASNENENLLTVINVTHTISNVQNTESADTENRTLQTVSCQTNIIKTESEETVMEYIEIPTSAEENRSMETYNPKLTTFNTLSEGLNCKSEIQRMELDSENATNGLDTRTSLNTNSDENNVSVDNHEVMEAKNKVNELKIKLEVEDHTSNTSEIRNNIEKLSSMYVIDVPKIEESVLPRKKSRNIKPAIKKRPTKAQQRKMYNKQMKQQLRAADNFAKGSEDSKKKSIQPYESVLKPLRAPQNNTDGFLCPFEMQGTCNDGGCKYIHSSLR